MATLSEPITFINIYTLIMIVYTANTWWIFKIVDFLFYHNFDLSSVAKMQMETLNYV